MRQQLPIVTSQEISDKAVDYFAWKGIPSYYQTTAYDTTLLISNNSSYDPFHEFELFGRKILWVNQVQDAIDKDPLMPRTIFPCKKDAFDGHIVAHRLSSVLCFITKAPITPRLWSGIAQPFPSVVQPSEKYIGRLISHDDLEAYIQHLQFDTFTEKRWIALAHYRQANIAQTPYYTVLSYWKIVELFSDSRATKMKSYINQLYNTRPDLFHDLEPLESSAWEKLKSIRHACAHFRLEGDVTQDPDNPDLFNEVSKAIFPLRRLAEELIEKHEGW